jgi:sugar phosphate isomerase/epimerase
MKLSTTLNIYSLIGNKNPHDRMIEAVRVCADCGYEAIDLYLKHVISLTESELDRWIDDMQSVIAERGVRVSQCHLYFGPTDKDHLREHEDKVARSMTIADRMGVPWGVIHGYHYNNIFGVSKEENIRMNVEMFQRLQDRVQPKTLGLAFENIMRSEFASPDTLVALCEKASPYGKVGVCWDTGHANLSDGIDQAESIRRLGAWLKCLHVHDNHGVTDEHILPMMGTIEWRSIMQALREINYTGDFVYESAQPTKHLPEDDILRKEMIRYSVTLGNYMLNQL